MSKKVVLFTLDNCGYCSSLKNRLNKLSIPYINVEINSNKELWDSLVNQTGQNVIPMVFIKSENTDNGPIYIPGKDYQNEDEIIEIIKTHL